jgi:uroporphyrinogen-III decarboxylase
LPPIRNLFNHSGFALGSAEFALPDVAAALENLKLIGQLSAQNVSNAKSFAEEAKEAGFPMQFGGQVLAPFDRLSDYFRGTRAGLLDMYRRPTDVVKACEKIVPLALESAVAACESSGNPRVFIPLHKAHDRFMSPQQFERFYWPSLHDLIVALIDQGLTPCPFWQGDCTSRLETIKDVPVGKACYAFESTDMFRAKQILGDTVCIRGNVPLSILATGAPDDVHAYCKKLIDFVGKDGGFIMDASASLDDAKPENVKAMFEFTRAYGTY